MHHDDLRDHAKHFAIGKDRSNPTWRNLAYWSYGLLKGFPPFNQVRDDQMHPAALNEIAVMNLKKTPGGSSAVQQEINEFARDASNQDFARREIRIIEPAVIICCGSPVNELMKDILDPMVPWSRTQNDLYYFRWKSSLAVAYFHPAWWQVPSAIIYSYLVGELRTLLQ
jgi:hypothetical protein